MSRPRTAVAIGALVLGMGIAGCGGGGDGADTSTSTSSTKSVDLKQAGAKVIKLDADWLVGTGDDVWVNAGPQFIRLDPDTGEQNGSVNVPGALCLQPMYAEGALYSATCGSDRGLVRVDPQKLKVTGDVSLPTPSVYNEEGNIAFGEEAIWIVVDGKSCEACVLRGLDPQTLKTTHEVDLDPGAESVAVANGLVWVTDSKKNRVLRVDPKTDEVVGETKVGGLPRYIAADENGVWVINQLEGNVMQLDPDSGDVVKTIEADMAGAGGSFKIADGSIWVRGTLTLLKQIDPSTGDIVAEYTPPSGGGDSLVQDGVLWITAVKELGHTGGKGSGILYRVPLSEID
jgi:streptogramin lyase